MQNDNRIKMTLVLFNFWLPWGRGKISPPEMKRGEGTAARHSIMFDFTLPALRRIASSDVVWLGHTLPLTLDPSIKNNVGWSAIQISSSAPTK